MANLLRKFAPLRQKGFQVLHRQPRLEGKVQAVAQDLPQLPDPGVDAVGGDEEPPPPASPRMAEASTAFSGITALLSPVKIRFQSGMISYF